MEREGMRTRDGEGSHQNNTPLSALMSAAKEAQAAGPASTNAVQNCHYSCKHKELTQAQ
jgi:hypothetical protein